MIAEIIADVIFGAIMLITGYYVGFTRGTRKTINEFKKWWCEK